MDLHGGTIDHAVNAYAGQWASPVVRDRARLMAADAIDRFQPTKGARLSSFIYGALQTLRQHAPRIGDPLPIPEQVRRDRGHLIEHARKMAEDLRREPTVEELMEATKLSRPRVERTLKALKAGIPMSTLEGDEEEDQDQTPIGKTRTPEDEWMEAVDHELDPIGKQILRYRTGYEGHPILPSQEIARRLNLSPAAISKRAGVIQARLDAWHDRSTK